MTTVSSAYSTIETVTAVIAGYWLKDVTTGDSLAVWVSDFTQLDHGVDVAEHDPLPDPDEEQTLPVMVFGAVRGVKVNVEFTTRDQAERATLLEMLSRRRPLLLQMPPDTASEVGEQWYLTFPDAQEKRFFRGLGPYRTITVAAVEVARP